MTPHATSLGYDRASREEERTHAEELALWGMPTLACKDVLSLPYRRVNSAVHCPLRTGVTTHLPTNTSVLMTAYRVLDSALHHKNQSFERSRRKREPTMFHDTKCANSASKYPPIGSSWAPTWPSTSTQHRLRARGFARHQTSSVLLASLFTRKCSSGLQLRPKEN